MSLLRTEERAERWSGETAPSFRVQNDARDGCPVAMTVRAELWQPSTPAPPPRERVDASTTTFLRSIPAFQGFGEGQLRRIRAALRPVWKSNLRRVRESCVDLHAIDATPARWRGEK